MSLTTIEVDVARGLIGRLRHRPVHKRRANVARHRLQGIAQQLCQPDCLQHHAAQLGEERRCRVRLVVLLIANTAGDDETAAFESCKFTLRCAGTGASIPNQLGCVETSLGLTKEHAKDTLLRFRNQQARSSSPRAGSKFTKNNCTACVSIRVRDSSR